MKTHTTSALHQFFKATSIKVTEIERAMLIRRIVPRGIRLCFM